MVVPRTPRPPIVAPKQVQPLLDPNEVERWIGRLARAIRLKRREQARDLVPRQQQDLEYRQR